MTKDKKLSKKEKGFVKDFVKTGNGTQSALKNYDTKDTNVAAAIASENLTKPKIQNAIKTLADQIPDEDVIAVHKELLNSHRIDHMVFPLGPKGEDDINFSGGKTSTEEELDEDDMEENDPIEKYVERTTLTDLEITQMLAEIGCRVRRIVHGNTARHVYFWSPDNMARDKAVDKAYKIKGTYAPEKKELSGSINVTTLTDEEKAKLDTLL